MAKSIGILTAGGDSPGLNAAIRAIGKSAIRDHGWNVIGFMDGLRGLMQNRYVRLDSDSLSGIVTRGGTVLGTGRDKVHKMDVGGESMDMRSVMLDTFDEHQLEAPLGIATEAVDRLHSTAHSHHRIIVVEIMGHNAGWLTLGAGLGGGADVIIIPEIPFSIDLVAESIKNRRTAGSPFSVVAVAEGAIEDRLAVELGALQLEYQATDRAGKTLIKERSRELFEARLSTVEIANQLSDRTSLESRVTILGHVQRGGTPSPDDRILAANLGTAATDVIARGEFGVMVAARGDGYTTVPLKEVAGKRHAVPLDHPWIRAARSLGVCMGDAD